MLMIRSSPVAKGASDISTDWDANANEDTPPQERYSGPTSALRNQEIRPPMLENHTYAFDRARTHVLVVCVSKL